jgi:hypothetical protein
VDDARSRHELVDLREVEGVRRCLVDEQLARSYSAGDGGEEARAVGVQHREEVLLGEVAAEPDMAARRLSPPGAQLGSDVSVEEAALVARAHPRVGGEQLLQPGGAAARAADDEHQAVAVVRQHSAATRRRASRPRIS